MHRHYAIVRRMAVPSLLFFSFYVSFLVFIYIIVLVSCGVYTKELVCTWYVLFDMLLGTPLIYHQIDPSQASASGQRTKYIIERIRVT